MKKLYFELNMGAAGDMLLAALYELIDDKEGFLGKLRALNLPKLEFIPERISKCGVYGTHMRVLASGQEEEYAHEGSHTHTHTHTHAHTHSHTYAHASEHEHDHDHERSYGYTEILELIGTLDLPEKVRQDALAVYRKLGEAESLVHGTDIEHIHFHEVGTLDALADIVGVCLAVYTLAPDEITASVIHVGSGSVKCAHGIVPVPAPATAILIKNIPVYGGDIKGELLTPTGAALLSHFVTAFGEPLTGSVIRIGYGMGSRDYPKLNAVRAFLLDTAIGVFDNKATDNKTDDNKTDTISKLETNIDDMAGEDIGYACETLMREGALDVYQIPVHMKKFRPGIILGVLCRPDDTDKMTKLIFKLTTTLGIRRETVSRAVLSREESISGGIRYKESSGWGVTRTKPEYEDRIK